MSRLVSMKMEIYEEGGGRDEEVRPLLPPVDIERGGGGEWENVGERVSVMAFLCWVCFAQNTSALLSATPQV